MNYYSVSKLNHDIIHSFLPQMPQVDLIVGIPRDGILVAVLVSNYRNIPFTDLDAFCEGKVYRPGAKHRNKQIYDAEIKNILVVDDICATGRAMREAKGQMGGLGHDARIYYSTVYAFEGKDKLGIGRQPGLLDFYGVELIRPCHYEWTQCDAVRLPQTIFDIDGILCPDCSKENDDDGERYERFLTESPLKLRPENVGAFITWRDEKYRGLTEAWLRKHGIKYHELIMARRSEWRNAIEFKADYYSRSKYTLFIESSSRQAKEIARLTDKPVIGRDSNEIFGGKLGL